MSGHFYQTMFGCNLSVSLVKNGHSTESGAHPTFVDKLNRTHVPTGHERPGDKANILNPPPPSVKGQYLMAFVYKVLTMNFYFRSLGLLNRMAHVGASLLRTNRK